MATRIAEAIPASVAAYIISARASVSAGSLTARTRYLPTRLSASNATMSLNGFAPCEGGRKLPFEGFARLAYEMSVNVSSACDIASNPVDATMVDGSV